MIKNKYYLIALLILVIDLVAKWIAQVKLYPHAPVNLISGYLRLSYVHNSGVAFGFFDDIQSAWKPYLLAAMAMVAIGVILVYGIHASQNRKLLHVALAITMGGILGNLVDRIFRGYVIDFIEFLPPDMVIQRLTGDPPPSELLAPDWAREKSLNIAMVKTRLEERDTWQGKKHLPPITKEK